MEAGFEEQDMLGIFQVRLTIVANHLDTGAMMSTSLHRLEGERIQIGLYPWR